MASAPGGGSGGMGGAGGGGGVAGGTGVTGSSQAGNDTAGSISLTTDGTGSGTATFQVNYSVTYGRATWPTISPASADAQAASWVLSGIGQNDHFVLSITLGANKNYTFTYNVGS